MDLDIPAWDLGASDDFTEISFEDNAKFWL